MGLAVAQTDCANYGADGLRNHDLHHKVLQQHAKQGAPISEEMALACVWDDQMLLDLGIETKFIPFVTIGGGLGSFAMVDLLRIAGVSSSDIEVIGPFDKSYGMLKVLLDNSQIPESERIRSGSSDRMDNLWGWPGYSLEEAFQDRRLAPIWHSVTEPILSEYHTPRASQVYSGIDREAQRIGWASMFTRGRVPFIRKRREGGYYIVIVPPENTSLSKLEIHQAKYVHLAVGFSGIHSLPDVITYKSKNHNNTFDSDGGIPRVVNVYEPHESIYQHVASHPSSILLRGAASSAMQVIQRLANDRKIAGSNVKLYHLIREHPDTAHQPLRSRIPTKNGFALQAFTFAKGSFGGQIQRKYRKLQDDEKRVALLGSIASTAIPRRSLWEHQLEEAKRNGWYEVLVGSAGGLEIGANGKVMSNIVKSDGSISRIETDFVIDATGVEASLEDHEILSDLVNCSGAKLNSIGQLDVNEAFEVEGTRSPGTDPSKPGRLFATGIATLGNPHCIAMYSFWGLQYSAWKTAEELSKDGFSKRIGFYRSTTSWIRRMRNREP